MGLFIAIRVLILKELQHFIPFQLQLLEDNSWGSPRGNSENVPKTKFFSIYVYLQSLPKMIEKEDSLGGRVRML